MASVKPPIPLTQYQTNWVTDASRFKIGVITRQGGKSFGTSLEAVLDCLEHRSMWVMLSAGERQSKELMGKAAMHSRAAGMVISETEGDYWVDKDTKYKQLEIVYPNGSRIVGLPANPDTARGWSANIVLDEFALHANSREIWKAMFPTVTRGYKIRIISTFRGKSNRHYEIFYGAPTLQRFNGPDFEHVGERGGWSKHLVTIHQAVAMGLELKDDEGNPIEPEDLRLALNDDDAWAEEYECIPSDEVSAFLTHELISSVEDPALQRMPAWAEALVEKAQANFREYMQTKREIAPPVEILTGMDWPNELYVGFDVGRKRDLSVIWLDARIEGVLVSQAVIDLRKQPYYVQRHVLWAILKRGCRRACVDCTGIGSQLAEDAVNHFGEHMVEAITFTSESKEAMAVGLKKNFEDRLSRIPADSAVRASLHSVKKYPTATKHFRFDAEKTEATGHADHFWAKGLVTQAASGPGGVIEYQSIQRKRFAEQKGCY